MRFVSPMMTLPAGDVNTSSLQTNPIDIPRPGQARSWPVRIVWASVFATLFAYVLVRIDPRVVYHAYFVVLPRSETHIVFPEFFLGWEFFKSFVVLPGGLTEYVGALASQFFFYPVAGAAILAAVGLGAWSLAGGIARKIGLRHARLIGLAPVVVLVAMWGRYTFHLADQLALLGALIVVRLYVTAPRPAARTIGFVLLSPVLYVILAGPYLLAAAMCGLFELLARRKTVSAVVCVVVGGAVPWLVGAELLGASVLDAYGRLTGALAIEPLETSPGTWELLLAATMGAALVLLVAGRWAVHRLIGASGAPGPDRRWHDVLAVALVVIAVGAALASYDRQAGRVLRINRYAKIGQWDKLLLVAAACSPDDLSVHSCRQVNRALFETGQLGNRMFAFPQRPDGLLPDARLDEIGFGLEDDLLAIGAVNQAEHLAAEALMVRGPTPHILRVLATAFMAKGEPQAARIFLTRLTRDLIHGPWARQRLAQLAQDPDLSDDETLQHIRAVMPKRDIVDAGDLETTLLTLLAANPRNQMAFEYLMASYLLDWCLDDLTGGLETYLPGMTYDRLPGHYAEAMVIRSSQHPLPNLHGLAIPKEVFQRAEQFAALKAAHGHDAKALTEALATDMADSYFRYHRTGQSGRTSP